MHRPALAGSPQLRILGSEIDRAEPVDHRLHMAWLRCVAERRVIECRNSAGDASHDGKIATRRIAPGGKARRIEIEPLGLGTQEPDRSLDVLEKWVWLAVDPVRYEPVSRQIPC